MRYLFKCIQYVVIMGVSTIASIVIWIYSVGANAAMEFIKKIVTYFSINTFVVPGTNYNLSQFVLNGFDFVGTYIVPFMHQLDYWLPVDFIIAMFAIGILGSMWFLAFRLIVKAITLGQV